MHPILRFETRTAGGPVEAPVTASATRLRWTHQNGSIDLVYETTDTIRLRGTGLGLRIGAAAPALTPFSGTYRTTAPACSRSCRSPSAPTCPPRSARPWRPPSKHT
jgi:hypothetical protein